MTEAQPKAVLRSDYRPPSFWIDRVDLRFDLGETETIVDARIALRRNERVADATTPLELVGEGLALRHVALDGRTLHASEYVANPDALVVPRVPAEFVLETRVAIRPRDNTELSGLYESGGMFCTQCEAEGFRRITYFLDRPDVMARYTTTIEADRARYPVLLSNGNREAAGDAADGRHWVRWSDPFPKPSYLFAMVAGDLRCHAGEFVTRSGRRVRLEIWVEPWNLDRCEHALRSLQAAMRWDEERFGREYDLDVYMIVAVGDFNMGAMENKGLNVFNAKYVLASPGTATDDDYEAIEAVIAHEYFHNWTGNRVTCRDWFQLTLKEGLTVFRDQLFTADRTSAAVKRIADVKRLWLAQFPEDAGPMAHPIRPESYVSMDNFYTATVYEKGAEVVRLYHTLLGEQGFRRGMDLYFERHDGQAVTCDDFRAAMADANGVDLVQLERWYDQAGTPRVRVTGRHDATARTYALRFEQLPPEPRVQERWQPMHVPVRMALLGPDGAELPLAFAGEGGPDVPRERVIELRDLVHEIVFRDMDSAPMPSLLRGYSAPVILEMERSREELAFQMGRDGDPFQRWDAGQRLASILLLELAAQLPAGRVVGAVPALDPAFVDALRRTLLDDRLDASLRALALVLPEERLLAQRVEPVDPDALHAAREHAIAGIAHVLRGELEATWQACRPRGPYRADRESIARRRLAHACLRYLGTLGAPEITQRIWQLFESADNMTDAQSALVLLADLDVPERERALARFYERWRDDPLVIDKWFTVQALSSLPDTVERVRALAHHPDYNVRNPNRVRALVGSFAAGNLLHFHRADGAGYALVAGAVLELDRLNPQVAARLATSFGPYRRFDAGRQKLAHAQLERIAAAQPLSKDVYEVVERSLRERR
jgi:aminopeptidase N